MARHRFVVPVALAVTLLLAGCADDTPTLPGARSSAATATTGTPSPSVSSGSPTSTVSTSPEPTPIVDDCLSGRWVLDVADLESQSVAWLRTAAVAVDSYEVTGSQRLDLAEGRLDLVSDLETRAVVGGRTLVWADTGAGGGDVAFSDGTLAAPSFAWRVRPQAPPDGAPTVPATDWTRPVAWACTPAGLGCGARTRPSPLATCVPDALRHAEKGPADTGGALLTDLRNPWPQRWAAGGAMSVCAGRLAMPTGQVSPLGPWLQ